MKKEVNEQLDQLEAEMRSFIEAHPTLRSQQLTVKKFDVYNLKNGDLLGRFQASNLKFYQFKITSTDTTIGEEV